jgi:hypothetical protein
MKRQTSLNQSKLRKSQSKIGQIDLDNLQTLEKTAAQRFDQYKDHFLNLTKRNLIITEYEVLSVIISNDNSRVICLFINKEQ